MAILELSAHMTVRPGQLEGFRKQAAECIRITKEQDTRTLRYDWFLSSDGTECEVREAYTAPEGLIEHNSHILEARTKLFKELRRRSLHDRVRSPLAAAARLAEDPPGRIQVVPVPSRTGAIRAHELVADSRGRPRGHPADVMGGMLCADD